jgi:hypothetical protein
MRGAWWDSSDPANRGARVAAKIGGRICDLLYTIVTLVVKSKSVPTG